MNPPYSKMGHPIGQPVSTTGRLRYIRRWIQRIDGGGCAAGVIVDSGFHFQGHCGAFYHIVFVSGLIDG